MKAQAPKTTSSALQTQKGNQPFFQKEGEGVFFSPDQVQLKAGKEHQYPSPFFGNPSAGEPFFTLSAAQPETAQKKGHEKGCGCAECSGKIRNTEPGATTPPLQRKQANSQMIQLRPSNVVNYTFLGVPVAGGVHTTMRARLRLVEAELQRQYDMLLPAASGGSLQNYAGLQSITGWQDRSGNHGTGRAVDVNYQNQPYIATRTTEGGTTTFGGEQGGATPATTALRRPAVEVYDRAVSFVNGESATADVSNRREGESAGDVYDRFRTTSDALATYFSLVFNTSYDTVTRPPIADPEAASEADLLQIPTEERKEESVAIAAITAFMQNDVWQLLHPNAPLNPPASVYREKFFRILRDYEIVRKPMQRGAPSTSPRDTRNPALGFLHMPRHFVVAMMDVGGLRWGACEFSARSNGDIHHFDLTPAHHTPAPTPAPATESGSEAVQEKPILQKQSNSNPERIQMQSGPSVASPDLESRLSATRGGGSPLPEDTRGSMESAFEADFSGVRVHADSQSMQMNQELGAQAFTHGSDIYFNQGKYDTGSSDGQRLLAHELTHVVQQGGGEIQPSLQLSRLRDFRDRAGYEPTDNEIEATNEYQAYTNERYVWQAELAMTPEEARLACRLILEAMQRGETVNWQRRAREFAFEARRQLSERTPEPDETESLEPVEEVAKICGPEVTAWLVAQMRANGTSAIANYLRNLNNSWNPVDWAEALAIWWYLVRTGGDWDFKTVLGRGLSEQFPDCRQNCTGRLWSVTLKGKCMTYEAPANIHYGYVGRMAGFSESRLLSGAADAQAREGRGETADDPRDVEAIRVGFRLFDQGDPNAFTADDLGANRYGRLPEGDGDPEDCEACSSVYNG